MPPFVDLTGKRFNNVVVVGYEGFNKGGGSRWKYLCDCGKESVCDIAWIKKIKSCGCLRNEKLIKMNTKHGMCETVENRAWRRIKQRCGNPNNDEYHNYGGRGIKVCDRWLNSFVNFFEDMGKRPVECHGIDRINNNGNYEPNNCKWASTFENNQHRRNCFMIPYKGKTYNNEELSRKLNINRGTLKYRYLNGLQLDKNPRIKNANKK